MTTHDPRSHLRLDVPSLGLLLIGLTFGALSYWLIEDHSANVLLIVPSVVAATLGASHIIKRQASRDHDT